MARVRIELFATLREKFGRGVEVECECLEDCFKKAARVLGEDFLKEVLDENGRVRDDRIITINGRNIKDEMKELEDGDVIAVFPPIAGG